MAKLPRCYWDSTCFLAWLKPEEENKRACQEVISAAERGEIQIVTSAVSLTEVIKLHKGLPIEIPKEHEERIVTFFQQEYIVVVQVTRFIAEDARSLIWRFPSLKPKDALHAATAVYAQAHSGPLEELHTFDRDFLPLDGKIGSPALRIRKPQMAQPPLPLEAPVAASADTAEEEDEVN